MAHILLVDDDPEVIAGNTAAIEELGHSVSYSSTMAEAAEFVRRESSGPRRSRGDPGRLL